MRMTRSKKLPSIFRVLQLAMIVLLALDLDESIAFWIVFCVALGVESALYVAEQEGESK